MIESTSKSGNAKVCIRKGDKTANEKDVFIEVYTSKRSQTLCSTLKVTDKLAKVYNDVVFGGIEWSQDESKICFIGEKPQRTEYKNPWEEKLKAAKTKNCEEDKKEDEHL